LSDLLIAMIIFVWHREIAKRCPLIANPEQCEIEDIHIKIEKLNINFIIS